MSAREKWLERYRDGEAKAALLCEKRRVQTNALTVRIGNHKPLRASRQSRRREGKRIHILERNRQRFTAESGPRPGLKPAAIESN